MSLSLSSFRQWVLGANWSRRAEHLAALDIEKRLRTDSTGRLIISTLIAALACSVAPVWLALGWGILIVLDEGLERTWPYRTPEEGGFRRGELTALLVHRVVGASLWAAMGLLWMLEEPAYQFLGLAILIGTLVHVSQLYNESRLQSLATALPAIFAFGTVVILVCMDPGRPVFDKFLITFAILALLTYLITSTVHNLQIRAQLGDLVLESARLAAEDALTGLSNRRRFEEIVQEYSAGERQVTVAFMDLDRFKPLNDEYGHSVGDEVLREIGTRLRSQPDMLAAARIGGDEFAVLLGSSGSDQETARKIEALHQQLTALIPTGAGNVSVGASIGWARTSGPGASVSEVLHAADVAMRRAKFERLNFVQYDPVVDSAAMASTALELAFRHALKAGRIRAALQPIVSVRDGSVVSLELLSRWPESGFARDPGPQDFIPIAERLGLLNELLWCTLEQALPKVSGTGQLLAINVSPSQLTATNFLFNLTVLITKHGVPPSRIELEVTEQVAFRNVAENCAVLDRARAVGYRVVLDDFGTGYSSLAMLGQLPLDKIKLDRAFVGELKDHAASKKILKATVSLAQELGICCSVEGIENAETAAMVASFGCDQMQGYWIGMPELVEPQPVLMDLAS
ncbi:putative bifunctional diguanylate cyclase/phosphodiesterase [Hyphomonas sp.]|uniref:putative bifunctional diguanylate cyclase/phosphodiesterase n=1 Tax=Hyphomonas sp. TaxID=87 RepID=UPI00391CD835